MRWILWAMAAVAAAVGVGAWLLGGWMPGAMLVWVPCALLAAALGFGAAVLGQQARTNRTLQALQRQQANHRNPDG